MAARFRGLQLNSSRLPLKDPVQIPLETTIPANLRDEINIISLVYHLQDCFIQICTEWLEVKAGLWNAQTNQKI